jgi:MerR, DNA binding
LPPPRGRVLRAVRKVSPSICEAQALGLTLKDVKELMANEGRGGHQRCRRVRDLLKTRLTDVDARIREMQAFRRTLRAHLNECERALEQDKPVCPVMVELGGASPPERWRLSGTRLLSSR